MGDRRCVFVCMYVSMKVFTLGSYLRWFLMGLKGKRKRLSLGDWGGGSLGIGMQKVGVVDGRSYRYALGHT